MNHINVLNTIKAELEENIANECESMIPDDENNDEHYIVQKRNYRIYLGSLMATEGNDILEETTPSLMLSIKDAKREDRVSRFTLRINVILWNPGTYRTQSYLPYDDENALGNVKFHRNEIESEIYERNSGGYIELWNMLDRIVDYISKRNLLAGFKTDRDNIKCDQERDATNGYPIDFYPYWNGYVEVPLIKEDRYIEEDIKEYL